MVHKGRKHASLKPDIVLALIAVATHLAHLTDKLDAVAKFARKANIHARKAANTAHRKGRIGIVHPVGQTDEQNELVSGIVTVNVQRGVGLGIAQLLGLLERNVKIHGVAGHLGQNIVAGAVKNAHERFNTVAREAFLERFHNGDGPGHAGFVTQNTLFAVGLLKQGQAFFSQQGFVGGNDVLALVEGAVDDGAGVVDTADKLHQHVDFGIIRKGAVVCGQLCSGGQLGAAGLGGVAHQHLFEHDGAPATAADKVGVFVEQAHKTAAHRTKSRKAHYQGFFAVLRHVASRSAA